MEIVEKPVVIKQIVLLMIATLLIGVVKVAVDNEYYGSLIGRTLSPDYRL